MERPKQQGIDANKQHSSDNGGTDALPDDVLLNILSHLSLKEAGRTSILSHRWRYLWRLAKGILRFYHRVTITRKNIAMEREKFLSWVNTVVELHQAPYIEGMVITFETKGQAYEFYNRMSRAFDSCFYFAMRKEAQRFELNLSGGCGYEFPSVARLMSHYDGTTSRLCHLKALRLVTVDIKDEVFHYFLASCPNLEEICLQSSNATLHLRVIDPPVLRVLEISTCSDIQSVEISAVSLVSFTYRGAKNVVLLKKVPNLRELSISGNFCDSFVIEPKEQCSWRYSVQLEKLALDFQTPDYCHTNWASPGFQLYFLKRLEVQVSTRAGRSLRFFTSFIEACPELREFRIEMSYTAFSPIWFLATVGFYGVTSPTVAKFVHTKLRVIEMAGYIGSSSDEEMLLELIRIGRPSIERVVIDTESDYYDLNFGLSSITGRCELRLPDFGVVPATTRSDAQEHAKQLASHFPREIQVSVT